MRVSIQIAAMVLALSVLSTSARSDTGADGTLRNRMVIYVGDLDLNTEGGAKVVLRRIKKGATKACGGQHSFSSYTGGLDNSYEECRETTIRKAVEQLNAPLVTRVYSEPKDDNTAHRSIVAGTRN